ncbi:ExbD/TolR family protein [Rubinisphaera italica]|uniref:Biopolymer transport protein ExbD/TolR n=1 Tax=Rubinisphaera italica TaxID=2527969 RepID=A0A5C5XA63_9PLAN|nr:biopolymer transporter ExbD [Rubinisphaera italica]TWT59860.1 Biopolymer transport protein ExbD/TolR [Rubinisphaera italica]HBN77564.1 biopolymer transporter ExbD [Planctomycetaceae bacterium]
MKLRNSRVSATKIEAQMAPMIDVVFQLLIFFMLTLKIIPLEGDFNINMPLGQQATESPDVPIPPIKVRLTANEDGTLAGVSMRQVSLGNDNLAFDRLNAEVGNLVGRRDNPFMDDLEVEIDADYNLHYRHVISAVSACTGYVNPQNGQVIRYVEKVKFAPPRRPGT